jgi:hypothetical protein
MQVGERPRPPSRDLSPDNSKFLAGMATTDG